MLYDRSYMRTPQAPPSGKYSAVTILLVVTIGIYILQQIVNVSFPGRGGGPSFLIERWFAFSAENFKELKVWTVVSYAFLHSSSNILHILFNMVVLFSFGRALEPLLGKQSFLILYLSGAVGGAVTYFLAHPTGFTYVVGASASISALLAFFCLQFYERKMTFMLYFVIPLTIKPKWAFWFFLGISTYLLFFSELRQTTNIAHSAHLGGFLMGAAYYRYFFNRQGSFGGSKPSVELPEWLKRRKKTESKISYQVNRTEQQKGELKEEVNRILDKINTSGFASLTDTEKATLDRAKEQFNR